MTDRTRIKIAATVTALFLAAISAVGLAARKDEPQTAAVAAPARSGELTATAVQTPSAAPADASSADDDGGYDDERDDDD